MYTYIFLPLGILLPLYIYKKYYLPTFFYMYEDDQHILIYDYNKSNQINAIEFIEIIERSTNEYHLIDDTKNKRILAYSNSSFNFDNLKNKCYILKK